MRPLLIASLAAPFALAACAGAPPDRPPAPAQTAKPAAAPTLAPSPCDEAGARLASARAALDEGRLLRARRWLKQASARCPARAAEGLPLEWRAAVALNDAEAIARLKSAAALAPDTHALREALASQAPYGGDIPADITPSAKEQDYTRAARAFLEGKLDEAGRGAMSVALSDNRRLRPEAFALLARVAEAAGDAPRAKRMFARAFQAACGSGCDAPVSPPHDDLFSLAAAYPGVRLTAQSCVGGSRGYVTLTPDGRFYIESTTSSAEIRAVPDRTLLHRIELKGGDQSPVVCFSEKALFYLVDSFDQRDRIFVGPLGGELRAVTGPRLWISDRFQLPLVSASGAVDVANNLDWDGKREWYRAGPGESALKRFPLPPKWFEPALLSSGEIIGLDVQFLKTGDRPLAVFDGTTGKRLRVLGAAPHGMQLVVSQDEQRVVQRLRYGELSVVDISTGRAWTVTTPTGDSLEGVVDASRAIMRDHEGRFVVHLARGDFEPAATIARPIKRAELRGGRIRIQLRDSVVAMSLSDGGISRDDSGVAFGLPTGPRPPGWDRDRPRAPCYNDVFVGESGALLYLCRNAIWRDHPATQAPAERLGELPHIAEGADISSWDEPSGMFFLVSAEELLIGQPMEKRLEGLRVRFASSAKGGIAIDDKGYFEFFGEVPDSFRKSASCGDGMPIEVCSDVYEAPGMVRRFLARDLSYRGP